MCHQIWEGVLLIIWSGLSLDQGRYAALIDLWGAVYITVIFHSFFGPGPQFRTFFNEKNVVLIWKTYFGGRKLNTWVWLQVFLFQTHFFSKLGRDGIRKISRMHQSKEIVEDWFVSRTFTKSSYNAPSLYFDRRIRLEGKIWAVFSNSSNNRFIA